VTLLVTLVVARELLAPRLAPCTAWASRWARGAACRHDAHRHAWGGLSGTRQAEGQRTGGAGL
jgi:hypothetical protein